MAKFNPGVLAGEISGRLGGDVFSHNKGGPYIRRGTIPTNPQTERQTAIRSILSLVSQSWQTLTIPQQKAWGIWAATNPVVDRLGKKITLTGHQCYVSLNTRLLNAGDDPIGVPPAVSAPLGLLTLALTADIGAGNVQIAFTETPLGADDRLYVQAAVLSSPGRNFVKNQLRQVTISDKAAASPLNIEGVVESVFGELGVGQKLSVQVSVLSSLTGLLSRPLSDSAIVVSTP